MMSSATSTEDLSPPLDAPPARAGDSGISAWQFFLLAGMLSATGVVLVAAGQTPASIIILSLTVVAASFVALAVYRSLSPLVNPSLVAPPLVAGRTRAALEREKTLVLRSIKELEFDFAMQKVAKGDFDELSGRLRTRAIGLMRQLDADGDYRTVIEAELAQRLAVAPSSSVSPASPTRADVAGQCSCGTYNDPDARFCKHCGNSLAEA